MRKEKSQSQCDLGDLFDRQEASGWDDYTLILLLHQFAEEQGLLDKLREFLDEQVQCENEMDDGDEVEEGEE